MPVKTKNFWLYMAVITGGILVLLLIVLPLAVFDDEHSANGSGADVLLQVPLVDGHNDLPINIKLQKQGKIQNFPFTENLRGNPDWNCSSCHTDLPRLRAGRVSSQFWSAFVECDSQSKDAVEQTLEQIDIIKRLTQKYPNDLQLVTTSQGIWDAFKAKKIGSLIGVEGGHSIDSRLGVLRQFYELGVRYMTLTHTCNTPWATASPADETTPTTNGLTEWGKLLVHELNRLGMMIDLSHTSYQVMKDALEITKAPVMFSHSSSYSICPMHRNVRDDILQLLKKNGGVIMINFYSNFVQCDPSKNATLDDVVKHFNYVKNLIGADHIGIGADFDGVSLVPVGLEDVSKFPNLFNRLANPDEGEEIWTTEELQKVAGLNIIRVFSEVEMVRDEMLKNGAQPEEEIIPMDKVNSVCRTDVKR